MQLDSGLGEAGVGGSQVAGAGQLVADDEVGCGQVHRSAGGRQQLRHRDPGGSTDRIPDQHRAVGNRERVVQHSRLRSGPAAPRRAVAVIRVDRPLSGSATGGQRSPGGTRPASATLDLVIGADVHPEASALGLQPLGEGRRSAPLPGWRAVVASRPPEFVRPLGETDTMSAQGGHPSSFQTRRAHLRPRARRPGDRAVPRTGVSSVSWPLNGSTDAAHDRVAVVAHRAQLVAQHARTDPFGRPAPPTLETSSGSAIWARVISTAATGPAATASSAMVTSTIEPWATTGTAPGDASRTAAATELASSRLKPAGRVAVGTGGAHRVDRSAHHGQQVGGRGVPVGPRSSERPSSRRLVRG